MSPLSLFFCAAVQSLHTLNDQISHFIVTKSKALEEDEDPFLPVEKETLRSSMILMRHLLMDAQVQRSVKTVCTEYTVTFLCFLFGKSCAKAFISHIHCTCLCDKQRCNRHSAILSIGFLIRHYWRFHIKIACFFKSKYEGLK